MQVRPHPRDEEVVHGFRCLVDLLLLGRQRNPVRVCMWLLFAYKSSCKVFDIHTYVYVYIYIHIHIVGMHACMHVYACVGMCMYVCRYARMYACM